MIMLSFCFLFLSFTAFCDQLMFVNNSQHGSSSTTDYVVTFNSDGDTLSAFPTNLSSTNIYNAGAVSCFNGNNFISTFQNGFFYIDLISKKEYILPTLYNYHSIGCQEKMNTVIGIGSYENDNNELIFRLNEIILITNNTELRLLERVIGSFPYSITKYYKTGYNTIFSIPNYQQTQVWTSWPSETYKSGYLLIMDSKTGKIINNYTYPNGSGVPYFTIPSSLNGSIFNGALLPNIDQDTVRWTQFEINHNDNTLSIKKQTNANYLYSNGLPQPICNGIGYAVYANDHNRVYSYDIFTGIKINEFEIYKYSQQQLDIGALVCL